MAQAQGVRHAHARGIAAAFAFAFKRTLPLMVGFAFCGISYGVYVVSIGLDPWLAPFMALAVVAGSAEFVMVDMLTAAFAPFAVFLTVLAINARHIFYGVSMLETYRGAGWKRIPLIYGLLDEVFAINHELKVPPELDRYWVYLWVTVQSCAYWIVSAGIGSYAASGLPFDLTGIDFVLKALFIVIFLDYWTSHPDHRTPLIGLGVSLLCLVVLGSDSFLVPALVSILVLLLVLRTKLDDAPPSPPEGPAGSQGDAPVAPLDGEGR